jgi:hypothetical protein
MRRAHDQGAAFALPPHAGGRVGSVSRAIVHGSKPEPTMTENTSSPHLNLHGPFSEPSTLAKASRMVHTESMSTDSEIEALRADIVALRTELAAVKAKTDDVDRAVRYHADDTTVHIKELYKRSREVYVYIMPLVQKVFPNMMKDLERVRAFVEGRLSPPDDEKSS